MIRKFVVLLVVVGMVLGLFSMAVAQDEKPGRGVSEEVQKILANRDKDVSVAEHVYGPPAFVSELRAIGYHVMARSKVQVNGEDLESDLPPVLRQGRILIPVRAVSNALDADVAWDPDTRTITITKGDIVVELEVDKVIFTVNGEERELDVPAQILSNRTFVPMRFITMALNEDIEWDAATGTAFIGRGKMASGEEDDDDDDEE